MTQEEKTEKLETIRSLKDKFFRGKILSIEVFKRLMNTEEVVRSTPVEQKGKKK